MLTKFKVYSPSTHAPCDSTHLAQRSYHFWKHREKSCLSTAITASSHSFWSPLCPESWCLLAASAIRGIARSHRGSCQESTGPTILVWFHTWPKTPVRDRMNGLGHWAEWDEWARSREEFCYKFCGHLAHAQVLCKNGLCESAHNAKIILYFPDGYV